MLFHTTLLAVGLLASSGTYQGWSIANIRIESPSQLSMLQDMGARSLACFDHMGPTPMLVDDTMISYATKLQIEFEIVETNIDRRLELFEAQRKVARERGLGGWYSDYKTWSQVNLRLQSFANNASDITTLFVVGTTHEGRSIYGIRITAPGDTTGRKQVLFNGCQHAREWVAVMVPMYIAEHLIMGWNSDPEIQSLLTTTEVIIVPIVNPDGYEFTYAPGGDRFWRKNRRNNTGSCEGVDLNRNWGYAWNGGDSNSSNTCSDIYIGPSVFSEPETQAMRDLVNTLPNLVSHIDFHSYSQLVLEPWASSNNPPPQVNIVKSLSGAMSDAIASVHGELYVAGTGGDLLYLADGVFPDWTTDGGSLSYTVELRPTGFPGFDLPPDQILPTCEENFAGAVAMLRFVNQPFSFTFPSGLPQFIVQGQFSSFPIVIESIFGDPIDTNSATLHVRYGTTGPFASRPMPQNADGTFAVDLPASPCGLQSEFWFSIDTPTGDTHRYPQGTGVLVAGVSSQVYAWNMDTNPNWTMEGLWDWGTPTGNGGQFGNPDPTSGATGNAVLGYNLNGDYENNLAETHLISEPLDLLNVQNVQLQFSRFLNVEQPIYDHATISVGSDALGWTFVWTNTTGIEDDQWQTVAYDISAVASNQQNVQIRWTMGQTDSGWQYSGWNIDDIEILAISSTALTGDVNCDGVVNVTDVLSIVSAWGPCAGICNEDIVPNGIIDVTDLLQAIGNW